LSLLGFDDPSRVSRLLSWVVRQLELARRVSMNPTARLPVLAGTLSAAPALCGCSPTAGKSWGSGGGTVFRSEGGTTTAYTVQRLTCDGSVYLVLAANGCKGSGGGGGSGASRGQLHTQDGREIVWSCSTRDGKGGNVVVVGQQFDLTRGGLFLISTKDKPTRVEQLAIDAGHLQEGSNPETFPGLANADPRIAAFLKSCRDGE
jgi:hypothetical protein